MKWFIASDIHGSEFYCKKMIEAFETEKADKMLLLGDLLYHGPRNDLPEGYNPKGVIQLLNNYKSKIVAVRGNCDTEVDQMVLDFPILSDYCYICDGVTTIFATHGHNYNPNTPPLLNKGEYLLTGHTHIPANLKTDDYIYINPGSVSIPKENSHHGYMIFFDNQFIWKNLSREIINI